MMRPGLGATYRIQLRPELGFAQATHRLPRLAELGVETLYCSPVAEAVPGSLHGYDGTDPTSLRAELGGRAGFEALSQACEDHGLGLCIDLVPNHLSTWPAGPWWRRLLAEGPGSEMAEVFDVAWETAGGRPGGKVALPLLDRPLEDAITSGIVRLGERCSTPVLLVGELDLPLSGGSVRVGEDLFEVLAAQHYRLVDFHDRADRNYRRFFDIDGLVGVRVEQAEVFALTHRLVVELAEAGSISAIRVDHVDGLREPRTYLRRLKAATELPIVVEKILTGDERLRSDWPVVGTTGYEVLDDIGGALVSASGQAALAAAGRADGDPSVAEAMALARRQVVHTSFEPEIARLAKGLEVDQDALAQTLARLPVYRTYLEPAALAGETPAGHEQAHDIEPQEDLALLWSAGGSPERDEVVAALLEPAKRPHALSAQQLMGAIMAKGVEDTAWYRLSGPLAFCEVGGDPGRDRRDGLARLHRRASERAAGKHTGLVPGSTHDTKRSADVRARLYALSEFPANFEEGLARLRSLLAERVQVSVAFDKATTRIIAETLLAVLPQQGWEDDLLARVADALVKGAREAKLKTSWIEPDLAYEAELREVCAACLEHQGELVRASFGALVDDVARLGAVLSLSAVVLRSGLPGIPDCYQGEETWRFSLVDPDNRRLVDEDALEALWRRLDAASAGPRELADMRRHWRDGAIKLLVTSRCLGARRLAADAFAPQARYVPLFAKGESAPSVCAFLRTGAANSAVLAIVTREPSKLPNSGDDLPSGASFGETVLELPLGAPWRWHDALGGRSLATRREVLVQEALGELPVGLLVSA